MTTVNVPDQKNQKIQHGKKTWAPAVGEPVNILSATDLIAEGRRVPAPFLHQKIPCAIFITFSDRANFFFYLHEHCCVSCADSRFLSLCLFFVLILHVGAPSSAKLNKRPLSKT